VIVYAVAEKKVFMPSMVVEFDMDEWLGHGLDVALAASACFSLLQPASGQFTSSV
jgi:hypothetical protein